jgi:catechol 2,3-dioxygenase-like lactoylglutathione lyase family enzyme
MTARFVENGFGSRRLADTPRAVAIALAAPQGESLRCLASPFAATNQILLSSTQVSDLATRSQARTGGTSMAAQPNNLNSEAKRISPAKFAHAVLRTTRFAEMTDWYRTVLNATIAYENKFLAFMTFDDEHHRIAIAAFPGTTERQPHSAGLDHLAYTYNSLGDLVSTYERLKSVGITPAVTINHGITTSMYYRDPDGNKVELQIDNYDNAQAMHDFMRSPTFEKNPIGVDFDPDELARGYHAGKSQAELVAYDEAKGFNRESLARLGQ